MTDKQTTTEQSAQRGQVHVYTGDGKGKTTAALGLALRAVGAGLHVAIVQFAKASECSELAALERFGDAISIRRFGTGTFIRGEPSPEDVEQARQGLEEARRCLVAGDHQLVILDEVCVAVHFALVDAREVLQTIRARAPHVDVVLTGRRAPQCLVDAADLVTEMRLVKHYYDKGVPARRGIED